MDAESAQFRNGRWVAVEPVIKEFGQGQPPVIKKVLFMELELDLKVDDLRILDNNADNLSYRKLKEYADNLQSGGYQAFRYLTMMHTKISAPFAAFVMVILGIPFALRNSRSGGIALGIGASVAIGFIYFVINAILLSYGRSGVLPPIVAAWGANLLFLIGWVWLSMTVKN
jgi:lipopolysaccharide export system permease protein